MYIPFMMRKPKYNLFKANKRKAEVLLEEDEEQEAKDQSVEEMEVDSEGEETAASSYMISGVLHADDIGDILR